MSNFNIKIKIIHFIFIFLSILKETLSQSLPSKVHKLKESNVTFEFQEEKISMKIYKNKTNKNTNETYEAYISTKLESIKEVFPNGNSFNVPLPKFKLINYDKKYSEQQVVDCRKSDIIATNILKNDNIFNKTSMINITYKLFNDSGWIDENTNYIQKGNLFLETRIFNYPFCEEIINSYNNKNFSTNNFEINNYPNCLENWKWDNNTKKYVEKESPKGVSNPSNHSSLEFTYSFENNDDTKFKYNVENGVPNQTESRSYMRIYRQLFTDRKIDWQLPNYPLISNEGKSITVRHKLFKNETINWIFYDLEYEKSPPNFRKVSTYIAYVIFIGIVVFIIFYLIKRKRKKDAMIEDEKNEKNQTLNSA